MLRLQPNTIQTRDARRETRDARRETRELGDALTSHVSCDDLGGLWACSDICMVCCHADDQGEIEINLHDLGGVLHPEFELNTGWDGPEWVPARMRVVRDDAGGEA